jgi:hypothetical protein
MQVKCFEPRQCRQVREHGRSVVVLRRLGVVGAVSDWGGIEREGFQIRQAGVRSGEGRGDGEGDGGKRGRGDESTNPPSGTPSPMAPD